MKYLLSILFSLLIFSCNQIELTENPNKNFSLEKVFENSNWEETDKGFSSSSNEKILYCRLGDAEPFECAGECVGLRNVEGHDFCVGCRVNGTLQGTLACTGSDQLITIVGYFAEQVPLSPVVYSITDNNGGIILSNTGLISNEAGKISFALTNNPEAIVDIELEIVGNLP